MNNTQQKITYVTEVRKAASHIIKGWEQLRIAGLHWSAEDLNNVLVDADMVGTINDGITMAHLQNIIGSTLPALNTLFIDQWHQSNLYPLQINLDE